MIAFALIRAFRFFRAHAGGIVGENARTALTLARAERDARDAGVVFVWEWDDDADYSWLDERQRAEEHQVEYCRAVLPCHVVTDRTHDTVNCDHAETLASLGGIFDADANYRRVVEAELASEVSARLQAILAE